MIVSEMTHRLFKRLISACAHGHARIRIAILTQIICVGGIKIPPMFFTIIEGYTVKQSAALALENNKACWSGAEQ